ncbi:MAG: hypothetical protein OXG81_05065 [Acidobacteria bacterium]|nr:hypothetical protein [Acidobacteriota bacterium]
MTPIAPGWSNPTVAMFTEWLADAGSRQWAPTVQPAGTPAHPVCGHV